MADSNIESNENTQTKGAPKVKDQLSEIMEAINGVKYALTSLTKDVEEIKAIVGFNDKSVKMPPKINNNPDVLPVGRGVYTIDSLKRR